MPNIFQLQSGPSAEVLNGLRLGDQVLKYPSTLGQKNSIPYVIFAPYKKDKGIDGFYSTDPGAVLDKLPSPNFAVVLPLPSSALKTSYGVAYDNYDLGGVGGNLLTGIKDTVDRYMGSSGGAGDVEAIAKGLGDLVFRAGALAGYDTVKAAVETAFSGAGSAVDTMLGVTQNPFTETIFKSVEPRNHTFTYTFIPKNETEAAVVDSIIQLFKFYMLPAHAGVTDAQTGFFSFPYEFQITYSVSDTTFALLPSVLKSFDVDYANGTDTPHFYKNDNRPAAITISMTFTEVMLMNRNQIEKGSRSSAVMDREVEETPNFTRFRF